jgi:hypothetical protein
MADLPEGYSIRQAAPAAPQGLPEGYSVRAAAPPQPEAVQPPTAEPPTLQQRAQDVYGFDTDIEKRGTILPYGVTKEGKTEWAVPQVGVDLLTSFLLPGHAAQGGSYTPEDALKFTLDYTAPATSHRLPTGARKAPTPKDAVRAAPATKELLQKGGAKFEAAKASGAKLDSDQYLDFLAKVEAKLSDEGVDPIAPELHPKVIQVFNSMTKRLGKDVDIGELQTIRRQMGIAAGTTSKELADERRIASSMIEMLDDTVEKVLAEPRMKEARTLWAAGKKSQVIEEIVEKATRQASGFENGLRIGFRQLLNNKARTRGFSEAEISVMKQIEAGTPVQKALRLLGGLGPKRSGDANSLRMLAGIGAGGMAGGPIGAMAVPAVGAAAGKMAERSTLGQVEYLRALAAMGGGAGQQGPSRLADALAAAGGPVAATQLPTITQSRSDQEKLAALLARGL